MKKIGIFLFAAMVVLCIAVLQPVKVSAAEIVDSGTCGENLTWSLDADGTLTISGTGAMPDYSSANEYPWNQYDSSVKKLVVADGVTSVGARAFSDCRRMSTAILGNSITSIGTYAFENCVSLPELTMPDSLLSIGEYAFEHCYALKNVLLGNGLKSIGADAFYSCSALSDIVLPDSLTKIGRAAFIHCTSLEQITIPDGVTDLADRTFEYCSGLKTVDLGNGVKSMGQYVFSKCTSLEEITIPNGVGHIMTCAFSSCSSLKKVVIPQSVFRIWNSAFYVCKNLTDVYYTGTYSQWDSIMVGERNEKLLQATLHTEYKVPAKLAITQQPQSVAVAEGERAAVTFTAQGDDLTYKWYYKNAGASKFSRTWTFTGNTYSAKMDSSRNGRQVYCVVTDRYGNSVRTETVTLSAKGVVITQQPQSVAANTGERAVITVGAQGEGLTYKWYYRNKGVSRFSRTGTFTGNTYSAQMDAQRDGRQVYCVITDKYGNSVRTEIVTMSAKGVVITRQPEAAATADGVRVKITVEAQGEGLTYKWYYKNVGTSRFSRTGTFTGNTYSVVMNSSRAGRQIYCVITDQYGNSVRTQTVTLVRK